MLGVDNCFYSTYNLGNNIYYISNDGKK